jgi:hypothetical protein
MKPQTQLKLRVNAVEGTVRCPHVHVSSTQSLRTNVAVRHTDRSCFV